MASDKPKTRRFSPERSRERRTSQVGRSSAIQESRADQVDNWRARPNGSKQDTPGWSRSSSNTNRAGFGRGRGIVNSEDENRRTKELSDKRIVPADRSKRKFERRERKILPLSWTKILELLPKEADEIILFLVDDWNGLYKLLEEGDVKSNVLVSLLELLVKAFSTTLNRNNRAHIMGRLLDSQLFKLHIPRFLLSRDVKIKLSSFAHLASVYQSFLSFMPDRSVDELEDCVRQCVLMAGVNIGRVNANIIQDLETIQETIEILRETRAKEAEEKRSERSEKQEMAKNPHNDFRKLSIMPTLEELRNEEKPFLRKNIVEGKYNDVDHYLDVHFRLLREDFIAPLRSGIVEYRARTDSRNIREIHIYSKVKILGEAECSVQGISYSLRFDPTQFRNVNWENSRRLMYGSLLCLSHDKFETVIFAVVTQRDVHDLNNGIVGVSFDDEYGMNRRLSFRDLKKTYVMAESTAYFEAYRHILRGLQVFTSRTFPLQKYIIDVQLPVSIRDCQPPAYIHDRFRNHIDKSVMRSLDTSQRRAFLLTFISAVAIIQGPPGTGKTYVGLKIVETLLNNPYRCRPILVVCLTNHALDQFLEGLINFTESLVRVGSRSNNEKLNDFNLKSVREEIRKDSGRKDSNFYYGRLLIIDELRWLKQTIESLKFQNSCLSKWILHERSLNILKGQDNKLVSSLRPDFVQFFGEDPTDQPWCPRSFLAAWLGVTYEGIVQDEMLEEFLSEEFSDFATPEKQVKTHLQEGELKEKNKDFDFIDIEDEWAKENRNRQLDSAIRDDFLRDIEAKINFNTWADTNLELDDEADNDLFCIRSKMIRGFIQRELAKTDSMADEEVVNVQNIWNLSLADRWRLYRRWRARFELHTFKTIDNEEKKFQETIKRLKEYQYSEDLQIFRSKLIIGFTTTGAAKYLDCLQVLGAKTVIVEEAAEVLESHIITCLSKRTQHLILIGDHRQLRPNVTDYKLGKDYHLDISLFERLIKNGIKYETLQLQHRMRPEISQLLVPHFYESLEDHPSVKSYREIIGVKSSLFFLNHSNPEQATRDSLTHENPFEADFLVALCKYLLQQGYIRSQITILTAYAGQLFALKNRMKKSDFKGVTVTVVDNYQGEENDIILLSFVRSNEEEKIGFLNTPNRVNVALSRAKKGLFCVGNFSVFAKKSEFWRGIIRDLDRRGLIGDEMELKCQMHGNISTVRNPRDFEEFAPQGGCNKPCGFVYSCGHECDNLCHGQKHSEKKETFEDLLFLDVAEKEEAEEEDDDEDYDKMKKCRVLVDHTLEKCGHQVTTECHINISRYKCKVEVERELPICGHLKKTKCHKNPEKDNCIVDCNFQLKCGHVCRKSCHPLNDPNHEKIKCFEICSKTCERGHKCQHLCFETCKCNECEILVEKVRLCGHTILYPCSRSIMAECSTFSKRVGPCENPCMRVLPCNHLCKLLCYQACGDCNEKVQKILPCGHEKEDVCFLEVSEITCDFPCLEILSCGHVCANKCGQPCADLCKSPVSRSGLCGHTIQVPCHLKNESVMDYKIYCEYPCEMVLPCGHRCKGTCRECRQGRVHVRCKCKCECVQICGHKCSFLCGKICLSCKKSCSNGCKHNKCDKNCGVPCKICPKHCDWKCEHHKCMRLCGDFCDRPRCNEPCKMLLKCGHPCIGLCGEKCPKICRICNFEELKEEKEDARFLELLDCGHCVEVEFMDRWMDSNEGEIGMKNCPQCKAIVRKSYRYGNVIKQRIQDVRNVKKIFTDKQLIPRKEMNKLSKVIDSDEELNKRFKEEAKKLKTRLNGRNLLYQEQLIIMHNQVNIMKTMSVLLKKAEINLKTETAKNVLQSEINSLCKRLLENNQEMKLWELEAINNEMYRAELLALFVDVEVTCSSLNELEEIRAVFDTQLPLNEEDKCKIIEAVKITEMLISDKERATIVKPVELNQGHWFKCTKGHYYFTGENEEAKCSQCTEEKSATSANP